MEQASHSFADFTVQFETINRAEENLKSKDDSAHLAYEQAVREWNVMFQAFIELANKHKESKAFQDSNIGKQLLKGTSLVKDESK